MNLPPPQRQLLAHAAGDGNLAAAIPCSKLQKSPDEVRNQASTAPAIDMVAIMVQMQMLMQDERNAQREKRREERERERVREERRIAE